MDERVDGNEDWLIRFLGGVKSNFDQFLERSIVNLETRKMFFQLLLRYMLNDFFSFFFGYGNSSP